MDQNGKYNEALMTTNLPFISRERCIKIVPYDFKPFVTFHKFCAGSEDGRGGNYGYLNDTGRVSSQHQLLHTVII